MKAESLRMLGIVMLLILLLWTAASWPVSAPVIGNLASPAETAQTSLTATMIAQSSRPTQEESRASTSQPSAADPTATAVPLWAPTTIEHANQRTSGGAGRATVAADSRGVVHLVWDNDLQFERGTHQVLLSYASESPDGRWAEPEYIITTTIIMTDVASVLGQIPPLLALNSHNRPHVLWQLEKRVLYMFKRDDGAWSRPAELPIACARTPCQPTALQLAVDGKDTAHVIWWQESKIWWSAYQASGAWSPAGALVAPAEHSEVSSPVLAADNKGGLHLVWVQSEYRQGRQLTTIQYANKPAGGDWTAGQSISGPAYRASGPLLTVDATGAVHVIWSDNSRSQQHAELLYAVHSPDGMWAAPTSILNNVARLDSRRALLSVGTSDLVLVWGYSPLQFAVKPAGGAWTAPGTITTPNLSNLSITGDLAGNLHAAWYSSNATHASEPLRTVMPAAATVQARPTGLPDFVLGAGPGERRAPALSGDTVVWNERGEQDTDMSIVAYDLASRSPLPLKLQASDKSEPAVSGDTIVWGVYKEARIHGYDLKSGQEFLVTAKSSPQFDPAISGDIVIFQDWRKVGTCGWGGSPEFGMGLSCDWDIWSANLRTKQELAVSIEPRVQRSARISGNTIIWQHEITTSQWAIYSGQIGSATPPKKLPIEGGIWDAALDGSIMVWAGSSGQISGILGYHLPSGSQFLISAQGSEPAISGNIVVWSDRRHGDADIYGYNLETGKEFAICTAPGDQITPAIDGDAVVWLDKRDFQTDIYGAKLPLRPGPQTDRFVPAPTLTPTPTATPTATPIRPQPARLLEPANRSTLDTLLPVFVYEAPVAAPGLHLSHQLIARGPAATWTGVSSCSADQGATLWKCPADENLLPGTTYTWTVETRYQECKADWSACAVSPAEFTFTTPNRPLSLPAPVPASPASGSTVNRDGVKLQWQPVAGASGYKVAWGECPDRFDTYTETDRPETWPSGLEAGKRYCWRVRARDAYAWSTWTEDQFRTAP